MNTAREPAYENEIIEEIVAHLHAAVIQSTPRDDQIIMDHVRAALSLARNGRSV